jgi:hypothetical protein
MSNIKIFDTLSTNFNSDPLPTKQKKNVKFAIDIEELDDDH